MMEDMQKVQVWIVCNEAYVLLLRVVKNRGGSWQPVTGHVEKGETLEEAAKREVKEETGLDWGSRSAKLDPLNMEFEFEGRFGKAKETVFRFAFKQTGKLPEIKLDPKEHVEWKWMKMDEVSEKLFYPIHRDAVLRLKNFSNDG